LQQTTEYQERLFDFDIVIRETDLEDATPEQAFDFLNWLHYDDRNRASALWRRFQKYIGATQLT
jgi:hypothetical protein